MPLTCGLFTSFLFFSLLVVAVAKGESSWEVNNENGFYVHAATSTENAELSSPFTIVVKTNSPSGYAPDIEEMQAHLLFYEGIYAPFELLSVENSEPLTYRFTLRPLLPGTYPLTFYTIPFRAIDKNLPPATLTSGIFTISTTAPTLEKDLFSYLAPLLPLQTPLPLQISGERRRKNTGGLAAREEMYEGVIKSKTIPWLGILGLLIFTLIGVALARKSRQGAAQPAQKIQRSKITLLEAEILLKSLDEKEGEQFFQQLMDAVRYYIEENYHFAAGTRTSEEFLREMTQREWSNDKTQQLKDFLTLCDLVRFANYRPTMEDIHRAYHYAKIISL